MEKTKREMLDILENLPASDETNYHAMTYEQGIEETLLWVLGKISDEEFAYTKKH